MDIAAVTELITTVGFPIACVIVLGLFIFVIYKQNTKSQTEFQAVSLKREEKLYDEIKKTREINSKAIETIALYAEKLDVIQSDINDIKTDIVVLTAKAE